MVSGRNALAIADNSRLFRRCRKLKQTCVPRAWTLSNIRYLSSATVCFLRSALNGTAPSLLWTRLLSSRFFAAVSTSFFKRFALRICFGTC